MGKSGARISLSIVIFGIVSILTIINVGNDALGQSFGNKWRDADFVQRNAVSEQARFSDLAQQLQSKIAEREFNLSNQLQTSSSSNSNSNSEGEGESFTSECVIATAAYGSNLAPQVQFLRDFRDYQIKSTVAGSSFMEIFNSWYYSFSPAVAEYERGQPWLQQTVRIVITPLLSILQLSENGYSLLDGESGALAAGLIAGSLIGAVYFGPIAFAILRKTNYITRIALYAMIFSLCSVALIPIGLFFENSGLLMFATAAFVLSILVTGATLVAEVLQKTVGWKVWKTSKLLRERPGSSTLVPAILIIVAMLCSVTQAALASAPSFDLSQGSLSKEAIEMQQRRVSEIKRELEEARRIESIFPDMVETQSLTTRTADFIDAFNTPGGGVTDEAFIEGLQYSSNNFIRLSSKVSNIPVADRHFTIKDTLSNAIQQLGYSTADLIEIRRCYPPCDHQRAGELFASSNLAVDASSQNIGTYTQLIGSEARQLQNLITEIENMPNSG